MFSDVQLSVQSYLDWWSDAGLIDPASDAPLPWTQAPAAPVAVEAPVRPNSGAAVSAAPPATAAPTDAPASLPATIPDTLPAFDSWLTTHANSIWSAWGPHAVMPAGPAQPDIMLVTDFPSEADVRVSALFSDEEEGALVRAMLTAIGRDIEQQRRSSVALHRPALQRLSDDACRQLVPLLWHQVALVQPKTLLVLGKQSFERMTGQTTIPVAEHQPIFNHNGGKTALFAVHHPRMLIDRPQLKRHAWEVLKRLKELV